MMGRRRRAARSAAMVAAGLVLVAAVGIHVTRPAGADTTLGSYSFIATAPGFEFTEDEPSAQAHPEGQGAAPFTTSMLANGGVGYGLSSIAWPGAYGGNAGSLVLVALPSQVGPVARPDAVTDAVKTAAPALQYPIRAEARAGSSPDAAYGQVPGTTLTAHADNTNVQAVANVQGAQQPGTATYGNLHSDSSSTLDGNSGKALANSLIQNVDIGGTIKIKAVSSTAIGQADGTTTTANGGTVVQGLTIAGQGAYLDQDGLHLGQSGPGQPVNATAAGVANQALAQLGVKVYVGQPHRDESQGVVTFTSGSVVFIWTPPNNPSKNVFVLTLGGSRVSVAAGQGFDTAAEPTPSSGGATSAVSGDTAASPLPATADIPAGTTGGSVGIPGTAATPGSRVRAPASLAGARPIAKTFGGVGMGWLLAGLAAAALIGAGGRRLIVDLVDRPAATCPLEVRR